MIYLIFGQDTYRSRQRLKEITGEIRKKYGATPACPAGKLDFYKFNAEEGRVNMERVLETGSLFGNKKLVILEKFSLVTNPEKLAKYISKFKDSKEIALVLWDEELDKKVLKMFESAASKTQEFKNLEGSALKNWILEEGKNRGVRLFPAHMEQLSFLGSDMWSIATALDKLAAVGDIEKNNFIEKNIFSLSDSIFINRKNALQSLAQLLHQGEDEHQLFSYLSGYLRTLLIVKTYLDKKAEPRSDLPAGKSTTGETVPAGFKIHPYVLKKATAVVKNIPAEKIKNVFLKAFEEDLKIKIGATRPREAMVSILMEV